MNGTRKPVCLWSLGVLSPSQCGGGSPTTRLSLRNYALNFSAQPNLSLLMRRRLCLPTSQVQLHVYVSDRSTIFQTIRLFFRPSEEHACSCPQATYIPPLEEA